MTKLRILLRYCFSAALALLLLLPCLTCLSASAAGITGSDIPDVTLGCGIYRIRNYATGLYIDAYRYTAKTDGKGYAAPFGGDEGQIICLEPVGNDSYKMIPQSESAIYSFCWNGGTAAGNRLFKTRQAADEQYTSFDIIRLASGAYTIAPSGGDNSYAVLTQGGAQSSFGDYYIEFADYEPGNTSQMWIFEPVALTKMTTAYNRTTLGLYSTGTFYARLYPYNYNSPDLCWTSSDEGVIMVGNDGRYCALGAGAATITASVGAVSTSFTVEVSAEDAFTWYSQNNMLTSDWYAGDLAGLYFSAEGYRKRFAVDAKSRPLYSSWIDEGCALCSVAMVLHNLGATLDSGYDLRSGQNGNLPADPYTVALANSGNTGPHSVSEIQYGSPVTMYWAAVARRFTVDGETVAQKKIFNPSRMTIKKMLDIHPAGVIVELKSGGNTHYVVFAKCINPEETVSSKLEFLVYDAAAYDPGEGDGVAFQKTTAYTYERYRYTSILSLLIYDVQSNING